jgi:hypothetical protein
MDGSKFDTLITRLASTHVTRWQALQGLAASAAVLAGIGLLDEEAGADRKRETNRKWCHRGDNVAILGKTKQLTKDQIKTHKKKHAADYRGRCTAARIVAPTAPTCTGLHEACASDGECCGEFGACDEGACCMLLDGPCTHVSDCCDVPIPNTELSCFSNVCRLAM